MRSKASAQSEVVRKLLRGQAPHAETITDPAQTRPHPRLQRWPLHLLLPPRPPAQICPSKPRRKAYHWRHPHRAACPRGPGSLHPAHKSPPHQRGRSPSWPTPAPSCRLPVRALIRVPPSTGLASQSSPQRTCKHLSEAALAGP
eukprot:UN2826